MRGLRMSEEQKVKRMSTSISVYKVCVQAILTTV